MTRLVYVQESDTASFPRELRLRIKYPMTKVSGSLQEIKGTEVAREAAVPQRGMGFSGCRPVNLTGSWATVWDGAPQ